MSDTEESKKTESNEQEKSKRKVSLSNRVRLVYTTASEPDGKGTSVECARDIFSVMEMITARLATTKSKEEMEAIRVSVHSLEDPEASDPLPEGEERLLLPYLVGGLDIDKMTIPDAMKALASAMVPAEWCLKNVEHLASQFFLRSRMDTLSVVATFDGVPAALPPFVSSVRPVEPASVASLYRALLGQAESLRKNYEARYPDVKVDWEGREPSPEDAADAVGRLVLPSGLPASVASQGVKTAEEIRKAGPRIIHLV